MENVKYIPGDLVKINGVVNVIDGIYSKSFSKDRVIEANALEGEDGARHRYDLDFGRVVTIEPIQLTPKILEANGWKLIQQGIDDEGFEYGKYFKDYQFPTLIFYPHIRGQVQNMSALINGKDIKDNLLYCHQLQHLLFGLGLPSELKYDMQK